MHGLGFRAVELEGIRDDHLLAMVARKDEIRSAMAELGLTMPFFCVVLPGLSSADRSERERNLTLFERGCDLARFLGARGVLDNGPLPPFGFPEDIPLVRHYDEEVVRGAHLPAGLVWERHWEDLAATYRRACDLAGDRGLTYLMHPCVGVLTATTDGFLLFRDAVDHPGLRFTLDTSNQFVLREHLPLALKRLAGAVDYIHFSDNRGVCVEHLPPGEGSIPWNSFFGALEETGYTGPIGIDVGGAESGLVNLEEAYRRSATWVAHRYPFHRAREGARS
jgi:sugar phosphate isomerase/epimerase